MRLYPPAALIVRAARRDIVLDNEQIRAGTTVYVPVYAVHRHEKLWSEPDRFDPRIATRLEPLKGFFPAESYHQDYLVLHPNSPYIVYNDLPKLEALKRLFPGHYRAEPKLVAAQRSQGSP